LAYQLATMSWHETRGSANIIQFTDFLPIRRKSGKNEKTLDSAAGGDAV
jgi:hypothetical protein